MFCGWAQKYEYLQYAVCSMQLQLQLAVKLSMLIQDSMFKVQGGYLLTCHHVHFEPGIAKQAWREKSAEGGAVLFF